MIPLSDPDIRRHTTPYVTVALLAVNVLVFLYELSLNNLDEFLFVYRYGVIPAELMGQVELGLVRLLPSNQLVDLSTPLPTWTTMFTSMFIHGGWLHLAGNMVFLWVFGDNIEDRFGHLRYLAFYLAAGIAAVWAQTLVNTGSETPMVGASGAIAGILGAYLLLYPHSRISTLIVVGFIFATRIPTMYLLGFWALLQAFNGLGALDTSPSTGGGVAYFAHLGGFAMGLSVIAAYRLIRREPLWPSPPWHRRPPSDPGDA